MGKGRWEKWHAFSFRSMFALASSAEGMSHGLGFEVLVTSAVLTSPQHVNLLCPAKSVTREWLAKDAGWDYFK